MWRGLVVGKFAPFHHGHRHLIATAAAGCTDLVVLCYAVPDFAAMPSDLRAGWITRAFPRLRVLIPRNAPPDAAPDAAHRAFLAGWLKARGIGVDTVFSSESYGPAFAAVLGATHVAVDPDRSRHPISGSALRANPALWPLWVDAVVLADLMAAPVPLDRRG